MRGSRLAGAQLAGSLRIGKRLIAGAPFGAGQLTGSFWIGVWSFEGGLDGF